MEGEDNAKEHSQRDNAYLPSDAYITGRVEFESANAFGSLTIPATSQSVISAASYDQNRDAFVGFSGRGFTSDNRIKPDIAAPGVGIVAAAGISDLTVVDLYLLHLCLELRHCSWSGE